MSNPVKVYRFRISTFPRLFRFIEDGIPDAIEYPPLVKGWGIAEWGWLIDPIEFRKHFPDACFFSKGETHPQYKLVKGWLFTFNAKKFFKTSDSRKMFECWVNPTCLYELDME